METSNSPCAFFSGNKTQKGPRTHLNSSFSCSSTVRREYTISGRALLNAAELSLAQENSSPPLLWQMVTCLSSLQGYDIFSSSHHLEQASTPVFQVSLGPPWSWHSYIFFKDRISSLCSSGCPRTQRSPTLTSQMLGLRLCAMAPCWDVFLQCCLFYVALAVLEQSLLLSIKHKVSSPGWLQMFYVGWPESPASTWFIGAETGASCLTRKSTLPRKYS